MRITLLRTTEAESEKFGIDKLNSTKTYKVNRIIFKTPQCVNIDYSDGDLTDPNADPMIIGTILDDGNYEIRALWSNVLWRVAHRQTNDLLSMFAGVKAEDIKQFAKSIRGT